MAGPAPAYQPTFSDAQVAECRALIRRQSAPQARVYRAKLALLLHGQPALDNEAAGRRLGKHANWVRYWRKAQTSPSPLRHMFAPGSGRESGSLTGGSPTTTTVSPSPRRVFLPFITASMCQVGRGGVCKAWATEGFRLADKSGRGRQPVFPPAAGGDGEGVGVRDPRAA